MSGTEATEILSAIQTDSSDHSGDAPESGSILHDEYRITPLIDESDAWTDEDFTDFSVLIGPA